MKKKQSTYRNKLFSVFKEKSLAIGAGILIVYAIVVMVIPLTVGEDGENLLNTLQAPIQNFCLEQMNWAETFFSECWREGESTC